MYISVHAVYIVYIMYITTLVSEYEPFLYGKT